MQHAIQCNEVERQLSSVLYSMYCSQVESLCSTVVVSGVGILTVRTPVHLLPAGYSWSTGVGGVVKVGALVSPASRLAWNNCCSHASFLALQESGAEQVWEGLVS